MSEHDGWPSGTQSERCPRCDNTSRRVYNGSAEREWRGAHLERSSTCVYDPGDKRADDILICLDCGCLFYRTGKRVTPHGMADDQWVVND